jgi:hypothetical protein
MKTKNCYSRILLLFLGFSFPFISFGQLIVDAGKDTTYCTGKGKMYLGTNVTIKNGVEPYSISWECKVPRGGLHPFYTAKDLLSDSTAVSPIIKGVPISNEWINFTLHVTDSQNNSARDDIKVRFSNFVLSTGYYGVELKKGDSILFNQSSVGGGIEPLSFYWQPKTGLSNPDSLITWCKPDYTTQYDIIAIDSCGCVSSPNTVYYVIVLPTGLNEVENSKDKSLYIKQVNSSVFFDNPRKLIANVLLYTINGAICSSFNVADDHFKIPNQLINKGVYIVKISVGELTGNSKFINL